jgi:hypothetical protein
MRADGFRRTLRSREWFAVTSQMSASNGHFEEPGAQPREPKVGYGRPPVHSRFAPGVSGNPSGRAKGSQNLKTLFQKILKEEVSLREGSVTKKISKAEAVLRGLVIGAMKGDARSVVALFKLAEQTGQFEDDRSDRPQEIVFRWMTPEESGDARSQPIPAVRQLSRE